MRQELPTTLLSLGIKMRDFAYGNPLPQLASIPCIPLQVQPESRPLKRRRNSEWSDVAEFTRSFPRRTFYFDSQEGGMSSQIARQRTEPRQVVRKDTEPDVPSSHSPMREIGHSGASLSVILTETHDAKLLAPMHFSPSRSTADILPMSEYARPHILSPETESRPHTPLATSGISSRQISLTFSDVDRQPALNMNMHSGKIDDIGPLPVLASFSRPTLAIPTLSPLSSHRDALKTPLDLIQDGAAVSDSPEDCGPRYQLRSRTRQGLPKLSSTNATSGNDLSPSPRKSGLRTRIRPKNIRQ